MKTHQITLTTLLLTFFLTSNLIAQPPSIDSIAIIPTNPTTNDTIKVVSYTTWGINPCSQTSSTINITNDTINVFAIHSGAGVFMPCGSIDTLTIGVLNAGTYELIYYLPDTFWTVIHDIDTINFTVQQVSGLQFIGNSEQEIKVYPNPTTTEISIDLKTHSDSKNNIDIYSVLGQKLKTFKAEKKIISVDISDLTDGIYFVVITNGNERRWTEKIIKNNR